MAQFHDGVTSSIALWLLTPRATGFAWFGILMVVTPDVMPVAGLPAENDALRSKRRPSRMDDGEIGVPLA